MFRLFFNISNPWSDRWENIKQWSGTTPFKHKFWEAQIDKTHDVIGVDIQYSVRQDHAGIFLCLAFLGYEVIFNFYDSRHWDHKTNNWAKD